MIRFTKAKHKLIKPKQSIKKQAALQKLNSFLNQQEPEAVEFLYRDLQGMQNAITYKELREAYLAGGITDEQFEEWQLGYAAMVDTALKPGWEEAAAQAAAEVKAKYPDFVYDPSVSASMEWLNQHGAELVTNLKQEQKQAINTMIAHCSGYTAVTPDEAARIIRPTIGLTVPQAVANARYRETVKQAYLDAHPRANPATAEKKAADAAAKYGARQHRYRAQSIARTELAFGYNAGHHGAIKDAMSQGFMGDCTKTWLTAYDERVCPECSHMDNETVNIDAFFSNGVEVPPAHPQCRCAVAYEEIAWDNEDFIQGVVGNEYMGSQIDNYLTDPARLGDNTAEEKYNDFLNHGVKVKALGRGSLKGVEYPMGGGYRAGDGGNKYFQYHPADRSHHGGEYYKISTSQDGTKWFKMDGTLMDETVKKKAFEERIFDGLDFEKQEIETPGLGKFVCYKGSDGCFYRTHTNGDGETVIEYAETQGEAEKNAFWDADWFSGPEEDQISQIRMALAQYTTQ